MEAQPGVGHGVEALGAGSAHAVRRPDDDRRRDPWIGAARDIRQVLPAQHHPVGAGDDERGHGQVVDDLLPRRRRAHAADGDESQVHPGAGLDTRAHLAVRPGRVLARLLLEARPRVGGDGLHLADLPEGAQPQEPVPGGRREGRVLRDRGVDQIGAAGGDVEAGHPAHGVADDGQRRGQRTRVGSVRGGAQAVGAQVLQGRLEVRCQAGARGRLIGEVLGVPARGVPVPAGVEGHDPVAGRTPAVDGLRPAGRGVGDAVGQDEDGRVVVVEGARQVAGQGRGCGEGR